jgi:hypothetical protein
LCVPLSFSSQVSQSKHHTHNKHKSSMPVPQTTPFSTGVRVSEVRCSASFRRCAVGWCTLNPRIAITKINAFVVVVVVVVAAAAAAAAAVARPVFADTRKTPPAVLSSSCTGQVTASTYAGSRDETTTRSKHYARTTLHRTARTHSTARTQTTPHPPRTHPHTASSTHASKHARTHTHTHTHKQIYYTCSYLHIISEARVPAGIHTGYNMVTGGLSLRCARARWS